MSRYCRPDSPGGGGGTGLNPITEEDRRVDSAAGALFDGSATMDPDTCMEMLRTFFAAADADGERNQHCDS